MMGCSGVDNPDLIPRLSITAICKVGAPEFLLLKFLCSAGTGLLGGLSGSLCIWAIACNVVGLPASVTFGGRCGIVGVASASGPLSGLNIGNSSSGLDAATDFTVLLLPGKHMICLFILAVWSRGLE